MITDHESLLETLDILADDDLMALIAEADDDVDNDDLEDLAEMVEEYGYGTLDTERGDHYDIDADNPSY